MYRFGDFSIHHIIERKFKLDGGSIFGVVPKKIWGKLVETDEDNLVPMQTNLFVVDTGENKILCDTGLGSLLSEQEQKIYAASGPTQIEAGLEEIGLTTDDIDIVFLSHLHTDHAGGAVVEQEGRIVPRFSNARYVVQRQEWGDALHPNERTSAVYIADRLRPLQEAGQLELIEGPVDFLKGVSFVKTSGHTAGHMGAEFRSGDKTVVYYADIIPFTHHFKVPYVASVDLYPLNTMKVKRSLVKRALAGEIIIAFDHDVEIPIGTAHEEGVKTVIRPVEM